MSHGFFKKSQNQKKKYVLITFKNISQKTLIYDLNVLLFILITGSRTVLFKIYFFQNSHIGLCLENK